VKLEWSVDGRNDREAIFDYIEADNPRAAVAVDERIQAQVETPREFPGIGRPGRVEGTRELVISRTPYIAAYALIEDAIRVLRALHSARLWPDDMPGA
jgi:toxin ParE1/3/4